MSSKQVVRKHKSKNRSDAVVDDEEDDDSLDDVYAEKVYDKSRSGNDQYVVYEDDDDDDLELFEADIDYSSNDSEIDYFNPKYSLTQEESVLMNMSDEKTQMANTESVVMATATAAAVAAVNEQKKTESSVDIMNYFVCQLQQVNCIIAGLLEELDKKGTGKQKNKGEQKHEHTNIDLLKKDRYICCIRIQDSRRKLCENCIVCQLISLQERIDVLLDKQFSGDSMYLKDLKEQQKNLKDQVTTLIKKLDDTAVDKDIVGSQVKPNESQVGVSTCLTPWKAVPKTRSKEKDSESAVEVSKGCSIFKYETDENKMNRLHQNVYLNCVNELVMLIKSMNCMSQPGTLWQKRIAQSTEKKKLDKCCNRDYPHMHGELNGVPVVLKLHPSKSKKGSVKDVRKEPSPQVVPVQEVESVIYTTDDEEVEEEDLVIKESSTLSETGGYILEDEEEDEEDDDDEEDSTSSDEESQETPSKTGDSVYELDNRRRGSPKSPIKIDNEKHSSSKTSRENDDSHSDSPSASNKKELKRQTGRGSASKRRTSDQNKPRSESDRATNSNTMPLLVLLLDKKLDNFISNKKYGENNKENELHRLGSTHTNSRNNNDDKRIGHEIHKQLNEQENTEKCFKDGENDEIPLRQLVLQGLTADKILYCYFTKNRNISFNIQLDDSGNCKIKCKSKTSSGIVSSTNQTQDLCLEDANVDDDKQCNIKDSKSLTDLKVDLSTTDSMSTISFELLLDQVLKTDSRFINIINDNKNSCDFFVAPSSNSESMLSAVTALTVATATTNPTTTTRESSDEFLTKAVNKEKRRGKFCINNNRSTFELLSTSLKTMALVKSYSSHRIRNIENEVNNKGFHINRKLLRRKKKDQWEETKHKVEVKRSVSLHSCLDCKYFPDPENIGILLSAETESLKTVTDRIDAKRSNKSKCNSNKSSISGCSRSIQRSVPRKKIKKLEKFLNLVSKSKKDLESHTVNNESGCETSESKSSLTSSDSSCLYESCDDTCNDDYDDTMTTIDEKINTKQLPPCSNVNSEEENRLYVLLKQEIQKFNSVLNIFENLINYSSLTGVSTLVDINNDHKTITNKDYTLQCNFKNETYYSKHFSELKSDPIYNPLIDYECQEYLKLTNKFQYDELYQKMNVNTNVSVYSKDIVCANVNILPNNNSDEVELDCISPTEPEKSNSIQDIMNFPSMFTRNSSEKMLKNNCGSDDQMDEIGTLSPQDSNELSDFSLETNSSNQFIVAGNNYKQSSSNMYNFRGNKSFDCRFRNTYEKRQMKEGNIHKNKNNYPLRFNDSVKIDAQSCQERNVIENSSEWTKNDSKKYIINVSGEISNTKYTGGISESIVCNQCTNFGSISNPPFEMRSNLSNNLCVDDKTEQSSSRAVKSILKKHSPTILKSSSKEFDSFKEHDDQDSKDRKSSNSSLSNTNEQRTLAKKSVKFSMPRNLSCKNINCNIKSSGQCKCTDSRFLLQANQSEELLAVMQPCENVKYNLNVFLIKQVKFLPVQYYFATRIQQVTLKEILCTRIINYKWKPTSSYHCHLRIPNSYKSLSYFLIAPDNVYDTEEEYLLNKQHAFDIDEKFGYICKTEIMHEIQYQLPLIQINKISLKVVVKLKNGKYRLRRWLPGRQCLAMPSIDNRALTPFGKVNQKDADKFKQFSAPQTVKTNNRNKFNMNASKSINDCLCETANTVLRNNVEFLSGKLKTGQFLFDISTTTDAVFSLTAYNYQECDNIPDNRKKLETKRPSTVPGNNTAGNKTKKEMVVKDFPINNTIATVNIPVNSMLISEPMVKKQINLMGEIVELTSRSLDELPKVYNECEAYNSTSDDYLKDISSDDVSSLEEFEKEYKLYVQENAKIRNLETKIWVKEATTCGEQEQSRVKYASLYTKNNYTNPSPFSFDKRESRKHNKVSVTSKPLYNTAFNTNKTNKNNALKNKLQKVLPIEGKTGTEDTAVEDKKAQLCAKPDVESPKISKESLDSTERLTKKDTRCETKWKYCSKSANTIHEARLTRMVSPKKGLGKDICSSSRSIHKMTDHQSKQNNVKPEEEGIITSEDSTVKDISMKGDKECPDGGKNEKPHPSQDLPNEMQPGSTTKLVKMRKELELITDIKMKINSTFPGNADIKENLLGTLCRWNKSNGSEEADCFGAPISDTFYNQYGKPLVDIKGVSIYDKNGLPKLGTLGKPVNNVLRNRIRIALKQVLPLSEPITRNQNFEEDLLRVLNTQKKLRTDTCGRIYDVYGRALFDCYGYLMYDENGTPLTDAYNRSLAIFKGKLSSSVNTLGFPRKVSLQKPKSILKSFGSSMNIQQSTEFVESNCEN